MRDDAAAQHRALRRELATSAQDLARLGSASAEEGARAEMAEELHAQAQADIARLTDALAAAEGACVAFGAFGGAAAAGWLQPRDAPGCNRMQRGATRRAGLPPKTSAPAAPSTACAARLQQPCAAIIISTLHRISGRCDVLCFCCPRAV